MDDVGGYKLHPVAMERDGFVRVWHENGRIVDMGCAGSIGVGGVGEISLMVNDLSGAGGFSSDRDGGLHVPGFIVDA